MKILLATAATAASYLAWQNWELTRFCVTEYQVASTKLEYPANVAVISDLHGFTYGKGNRRLLRRVQGLKPHAIFIPGDMIVSKYSGTYQTALKTLQRLVKIAPVYYSYGNHESRMRTPTKRDHPLFLRYMEDIRRAGVNVMETESREISLNGNQVTLSALELELDYYEKGRIVPMGPGYLEQSLGVGDKEQLQILLAHNPAYAKEYAAWGADVSFCGHNHGGLIRIPGVGSILSPQLTWFPKYDAGKFQIGGKTVIVSRGLGTHTFHIRVFNRAELVSVKFIPKGKIS